MGLYNFLFGSGSSSRRNRGGMSEEYRNALRELRKQRSKWYRILRSAIIIAAALATTLLILAILVADLRHAWSFKLIFIVYALIFGGSMCLPWITELARDERRAKNGENVAKWRKWVAFGFFGLIGVSTVFWIISVFTIGDDFIGRLIDGAAMDEIAGSAFTPLRIAIILTLQVLFGSVVATSTLRYGKQYLALRIVMYVTLAYLDIWASWLAGTITVAKINAHTVMPIYNTGLWVLAVLAVVGLGTAGGIFGAHARRKEIELIMKGDVKNLTEGDVLLVDAQTTSSVYTEPPKQTAAPAEKDPEAQLAKIKELLDKGVITEEEYQRKRQDIIDKM